MMDDRSWGEEISLTIQALAKGHYSLRDANAALDDDEYEVQGYSDRLRVIDAASLAVTRGKWLYGRATGEVADFAERTGSSRDLAEARAAIDDAIGLAERSRAPSSAVSARATAALGALHRPGTEILYDGDMPIVPSIAPIIILRGSSRDMGKQYIQQSLEIFGRFAFEHVASKQFADDVLAVLRSWEAEMAAHTPELLEMAHGMAEAAASLGVTLSYDHALSMMAGVRPPEDESAPLGVLEAEGGGYMGTYVRDYQFFFELGSSDQPSPQAPCSGTAAWGGATADGKSHFAASTDHDCSFQVTIVAFPNDGNAFIYTPFVVNGALPIMGHFGFAGHPGMNSAGVAYVHHGGGTGCFDNKYWGYGVPRGASTLHILRYAQSAREALEMELAMPVGNAGRLLGTPGGFYVDDTYGYVLEDRNPTRPVYRERTPGHDGEAYDVLYATNNLQSPELGEAYSPPPDGYTYEVEAGWYTDAPQGPDECSPGALTRQLCTTGSAPRNRYLYKHLTAFHGAITAEDLVGFWRRGPQFAAESGVAGNGAGTPPKMIEGSVAHRCNAFVSFGTPSTGRYSGAVGLVAPRNTYHAGGHGFYYLDQTHTYWDLYLGEGPEALVADARATAEREIREAEQRLDTERGRFGDAQALDELLAEARRELFEGEAVVIPDDAFTNDRVAAQARACRAVTRAQVRARQVIEAVDGPREGIARAA